MNHESISFTKFEEEVLRDPQVLKVYNELEEEFALAAEMLKARKMARKTQKEVARKMRTSQATVARIENGFGHEKHSPTIDTLRRYAKAVGCKIFIKLIPYHG